MIAHLQRPVLVSCSIIPGRKLARPFLLRKRTASSIRADAAIVIDKPLLFEQLGNACTKMQKAEPAERLAFSKSVLDTMVQLRDGQALPKWGASATDVVRRRNVMVGELRQVGIKNPDKLSVGSVRNDAAFVFAVVGSTSVLAVAAGQLPGDWGFFSSYLIGSISLVVLAVGSIAPGLLAVLINQFNLIFPDYKQRVLRHEAAHFLCGYLLGIPVAGYSLDLGKEHTEFVEAKLQRRIMERFQLEDAELDRLAVMSVAGIAAEGTNFEEVMGQTADLMELQRLLERAQSKLSDSQQQNLTRWAVWQAASLLRQYKKEYAALMEVMQRGGSIPECLQAIEGA